MDEDGSGRVDKTEFKKAMEHLKIPVGLKEVETHFFLFYFISVLNAPRFPAFSGFEFTAYQHTPLRYCSSLGGNDILSLR